MAITLRIVDLSADDEHSVSIIHLFHFYFTITISDDDGWDFFARINGKNRGWGMEVWLTE